MLSTENLEKLITEKKREIEQEKALLGISRGGDNVEENNKTSKSEPRERNRPRALSENNASPDSSLQEKSNQDEISPGLERYIRRYVGLPPMLKAGEFSPNNPLLRGVNDKSSGDVLFGLGEYERRRNTLRKMRQRQYKEYLDQQAKKKQEAKEQAERERKEREERERLREERERERLELEGIESPERRRASVSHAYVSGANNTYITKVDTGVQVEHRSTPLSVAVQTDDEPIYRTTPSPGRNLLTQAERELSPHTVGDDKQMQFASHQWEWKEWDRNNERRRSYGDFDDRLAVARKPRDRLASELRHSYMPSIFDAEAIRLRNERAEKEAAERRHSYQQELKNQILEQQRIKEERKNREKMLEQAEMRRLEEQLRSLRAAQEREIDRHRHINTQMKDNATEYERKRTTLQKEIDLEHQALLKAAIHPKRHPSTSQSDSPVHSKLPFFYQKPPFSTNIPDNSIFSQNYDVENYLRRNLNPSKESLCSNKIDNKNTVIEKALVHDVPKELRNFRQNEDRIYERDPRKFTENLEKDSRNFTAKDSRTYSENTEKSREYTKNLRRTNNEDRIYEKETRKLPENIEKLQENYQNPNCVTENVEKIWNLEANRKIDNAEKLRNIEEKMFDTLPIPVLRHSPKPKVNFEEKTSELSEKMQMVDDKWKVPAVQKNILKTLPSEKGKNVSILTQLGSIRRQLQLEQMKLDKMLSKNH